MQNENIWSANSTNSNNKDSSRTNNSAHNHSDYKRLILNAGTGHETEKGAFYNFRKIKSEFVVLGKTWKIHPTPKHALSSPAIPSEPHDAHSHTDSQNTHIKTYAFNGRRKTFINTRYKNPEWRWYGAERCVPHTSKLRQRTENLFSNRFWVVRWVGAYPCPCRCACSWARICRLCGNIQYVSFYIQPRRSQSSLYMWNQPSLFIPGIKYIYLYIVYFIFFSADICWDLL